MKETAQPRPVVVLELPRRFESAEKASAAGVVGIVGMAREIGDGVPADPYPVLPERLPAVIR
jgi:hypothetical protein